jgi:hypothetical protein
VPLTSGRVGEERRNVIIRRYLWKINKSPSPRLPSPFCAPRGALCLFLRPIAGEPKVPVKSAFGCPQAVSPAMTIRNGIVSSSKGRDASRVFAGLERWNLFQSPKGLRPPDQRWSKTYVGWRTYLFGDGETLLSVFSAHFNRAKNREASEDLKPENFHWVALPFHATVAAPITDRLGRDSQMHDRCSSRLPA